MLVASLRTVRGALSCKLLSKPEYVCFLQTASSAALVQPSAWHRGRSSNLLQPTQRPHCPTPGPRQAHEARGTWAFQNIPMAGPWSDFARNFLLQVPLQLFAQKRKQTIPGPPLPLQKTSVAASLNEICKIGIASTCAKPGLPGT